MAYLDTISCLTATFTLTSPIILHRRTTQTLRMNHHMLRALDIWQLHVHCYTGLSGSADILLCSHLTGNVRVSLRHPSFLEETSKGNDEGWTEPDRRTTFPVAWYCHIGVRPFHSTATVVMSMPGPACSGIAAAYSRLVCSSRLAIRVRLGVPRSPCRSARRSSHRPGGPSARGRRRALRPARPALPHQREVSSGWWGRG